MFLKVCQHLIVSGMKWIGMLFRLDDRRWAEDAFSDVGGESADDILPGTVLPPRACDHHLPLWEVPEHRLQARQVSKRRSNAVLKSDFEVM